MNIEEMKQRIEILNKESSNVNSLRNQNIGKRATLEKQCNELCNTYKELYGVEISPENLTVEIQKVTAEKEKEINLISGVLEAIKSQDYNKANELLGLNSNKEEEIKVATSVEIESTGKENTVTEEVVSAEQVVNVAPPVNVTPPVSVAPPVDVAPPVSVAPPVNIAPPVNVAPPLGVTPPPTSVENKDNSSISKSVEEFKETIPKAPMPALEGFTSFNSGNESSFSMPNLDTQKASQEKITSFEGILGGSQFKNN